jgi:putative transposase
MSNTYSQVYIQAVFAVKHRSNFITTEWRDQLHSYVSGIITKQGSKSLAVGGWLDHIHVFFGLNPSQSISDLVREIKSSSSGWINEQNFIKQKFEWQSGFGAFSYSKSQRDNVIKYIMNQEQHHQQETFKTEYFSLLNEFRIEFDEKYLFHFFDE